MTDTPQPKMMEKFAQEYVTANYRYISAYNELNARTSQRQQALTIFITFFIGLLAALIAAHNVTTNLNSHIEWIMFGFPVASATFAFLNYKYERIITNLRSFLSSLERYHDAHLEIPSYNTNQQWVNDSNHARRFHDYACAILILACNSIGISAFYVLFPEHVAQSYFVIFFVVLIAMLTAILHWFLPKFGYQPPA
ncbi:hypothetical protein GCM10023206_25040 [Acinetobacter puyangensis]|uniref:Uncharacterized protein n=1 Tax=Acinetobacter puyangensis TaxID=1096779 RepID=A0A240E4P4_9GAMM|nr:hypothetical protein [Acinetobacter puyangensis]SNX43727.1 hypothetical protein SAMN05421731_101771 [Acinetobacter puyangensis]